MSREGFFFRNEHEADEAVDSLFGNLHSVRRVVRGAGFCLEVSCHLCYKANVLWHHEGDYYCPECRKPGKIIKERGIVEQEHIGQPFNQVRVEFSYDMSSERYTKIAIVQEESFPQGATYTAQLPLVHTDKRALKMAEVFLCRLNDYGCRVEDVIDEVPQVREFVLNLEHSKEEFTRRLHRLMALWQENTLLRSTPVVSQSRREEETGRRSQ